MGPVYAHCPHCTFPVVVMAGDEKAGRYCRQCRRLFVPADCMEFAAAGAAGGRQKRSGKNRMTWRNLLQRKPATPVEGKE